MGPKKIKTRHSSGSCFGSSASLPDTGNLFTLRDVVAAFQREVELNPGSSSNNISLKLEAEIRQKWLQDNPQLPLMNPKSVAQVLFKYHLIMF